MTDTRARIGAQTRIPANQQWRACIFGTLMWVLLTSSLRADVGRGDRSKDNIVLGMSTALTGLTANTGLNARAGVRAAIEEINQAGGINGRMLHLISLDDGYEPQHTAPNMRRLIEEDRVLAIIGNVGTPTAVTAIPIASASKTLFFGALTGAGVLRTDPPNRYVINYRASYAEEAAAMVEALSQNLGLRPEEIAFFTQRDAYGDAGFAGGIAALKRHGLEDENRVAHGRYERNTLAVENALADILLHEPRVKAVIVVGTYAPCAEFIRLARQSGLDVPFLCISFVGAAPFAKALGTAGDGVIVTQVVPHFDADLPLAKDYRAAMSAWDPDAGFTFGSLEGYVVVRIFCHALKRVQGDPDREAIVDTLEALGEFDIGLGVPLRLGPGEHQASHRIWPTVLSGGRTIPFDWSQLSHPTGVEK